jgi:mono/diheme cytochrome c family protein
MSIHIEKKMQRIIVSGLTVFLFAGSILGAEPRDPSHKAWLESKCALCHGEDGAGNTTQGKRTQVPDLRGKEVQKLTDAKLTKKIVDGHARMPSFKERLTNEQVKLLVAYIRRIGTSK